MTLSSSRATPEESRSSGLQATVNLFFPEAANDRLTLNGLGGDDVINAASLEADGIQLTMNGGLGEDLFLGSEGNDLINGGDGDDTALMGAGDDTFVWNPGDDNDTVEGQAGFDTLLFNGANVAENIDISANGGRALFTRDIANVTMDLNDVENIDFNALGGADTIEVNDLSGTDVTEVNINLAAAGGRRRRSAGHDRHQCHERRRRDPGRRRQQRGHDLGPGRHGEYHRLRAPTTGSSSMGSPATTSSRRRGLRRASIQLTANGGDGQRHPDRRPGDDILHGGDGDDVLIGGGGLDVLDGDEPERLIFSSSSAVAARVNWGNCFDRPSPKRCLGC